MADPQYRARLLLVDDDRLVLATLSSGLRAAGYEVAIAGTAQAALELARDRRPDLAILDIAMPTRSGLDLAGDLQALDVPFMFLSALNREETVLRANRTAALTYLVKPTDVDRLLPTIASALARAAELRALRQAGQTLETALKQGREVSIAIGVLMERFRLGRDAAFERLRREARSQRRKVTEVATEIIVAAEGRDAGAPDPDVAALREDAGRQAGGPGRDP